MAKVDMFAIVLVLQHEAECALQNLLEEIERQFGYSFIRSNGCKPHITLVSSIEEQSLSQLKDICAAIASETKVTGLEMRCVSLMCHQHPLVYIRWSVTKDLLYLKERIQGVLREQTGQSYRDTIWDNEEWMAKTSLIGYDTDYSESLLDAIKLIRERLTEQLSTQAIGLALVRYDKHEEMVATYWLQEK